MTLEGKEMVCTRITWGELVGANSEGGETTEFKCNTFAKPCYSSFLSNKMVANLEGAWDLSPCFRGSLQSSHRGMDKL